MVSASRSTGHHGYVPVAGLLPLILDDPPTKHATHGSPIVSVGLNRGGRGLGGFSANTMGAGWLRFRSSLTMVEE